MDDNDNLDIFFKNEKQMIDMNNEIGELEIEEKEFVSFKIDDSINLRHKNVWKKINFIYFN